MSDVTTDTGWRDGSLTAGRRWWDSPAADRLMVIFGLWLAVPLIYWPSAVALNGIWRGASGDSYTHGYLVLLASLWLIWRDRERLATTPVRPVAWAWLAVLMLSAAWLWSWRAAIQALHVLLLPAILLMALVAALGWLVARRCVFAIGLLLFAMPIWNPLTQSLQDASAKMTEAMIWLSGMPAYVRGDFIHLPGGTIEIAQACAGLNGVVIGLTVAALYGEIMRDPLRRRLIWLGLMGILALAANGIRIFVVTVAAYETDMRSPLVRHHIWLGWVLFTVAVGVFLAISARAANAWDRKSPAQASGTTLGGQGAGSEMPRSSTAVRLARLAVALACLALLPMLSYGMDLARSENQSHLAIEWPQAPKDWRGPMPDKVTAWAPRFLDSSAESLRMYVDPRARPIEVFAVAYREQTQDAKLLGFRNELLGSPKELKAGSQGIVSSPVGRWRETLAVDPTGTRSLIWWRYRIGRRVFTDPRLSQVWYGLEAMTGIPPVSSLTAFRVSCTADCKAAREQLAAAAVRLQPSMSLQSPGEAERAR